MLKVPFAVLIGVLLNGIGARSNGCDDYCDGSRIVSSYCTDSRNCVERVRRDQIMELFAHSEMYCYQERKPVFPAYIESISASVHNETLLLNISWQWPAMNVVDNLNGYGAFWGLQYIVTARDESRSNCYSVSLTKKDIEQGSLSIPCTRFEDGGFPETLEFNVTALAFVAERFIRGSPFTFTPTRLQEITVNAGRLDGGSVSMEWMSVSPWNAEMSYEFYDHVLTVSFTPAPLSVGYTSYEVWIFKAEKSRCVPSASYVDKANTMPYWPKTSVSFNTTDYEECSKYCIGLHPIRNSTQTLCPEGCITEMHDSLIFQVPSRILKCIYWNADLYLLTDPFENKITVSFILGPEYDFCFENFRIELFSPFTSVCRPPGKRIKSTTFHWNSSEAVVTFEGLGYGNYCARISPIHEACGTKNRDICALRYSNIYNLGEPPPAVGPPSTQTADESPAIFNKAMMISVVAVFVVIIMVTIGGIVWRKSRARPNVESNMNNNNSVEEDIWLLAGPSTNASRKIVVLYTHDEKTSKQARALSDFLVHCRGYMVFMDEDHKEKIFAGTPGFLTAVLAFSCPQYAYNRRNTSSGDFKRIIVVKSNRAARLLKKQDIIMEGIIGSDSVNYKNPNSNRPDSTDVELNCDSYKNVPSDEEAPSSFNLKKLDESFFCQAVTSLPSLTNSVMDACHIFVVQFGDTEIHESHTFRLLTPGQRYILPRHLDELCLNLDGIDYPDTVRSKLQNEMPRQWREHESYKELIKVCH